MAWRDDIGVGWEAIFPLLWLRFGFRVRCIKSIVELHNPRRSSLIFWNMVSSTLRWISVKMHALCLTRWQPLMSATLRGTSLKLHLISVRDRIVCGIIRFLRWTDTRDMAADGLTKCGIDRTILHNLSQECLFDCKHDVLRHPKTSSSIGLHVSQLTTKGDNISQSNTATSTFQRSNIHGYTKPSKVYWSDEGLNF